ncbi:MAG: hypothetical protein EB084_18815 [Proteobacteria bacterium]|nr:hypothetical protein [Pseudomonadota bacterium]
MKKLQVRPIEVDDASQLADMEGRYPVSMRHGETGLRSRLEGLAKMQAAFASICHDEHGACLGYLIAWRGATLVDVPRPEPVVFIDDLQAADPRALYPLLSQLADDIEAKSMQSLPIEGVCRRSAYRLFNEHQSVIRRLGYELHATYEYWDDELGEELCWMRWRSLRVGATSDLTDAWAPRPGEGDVAEWDSFNDTVESIDFSGGDQVDIGLSASLPSLSEASPEDDQPLPASV